jgi:hypothetical protein
MLLSAVSSILSIIAAIFGQCGSHGCRRSVDHWTKQPAIATAGEANTLSNKKKATSWERSFTADADLILLDAHPSRI